MNGYKTYAAGLGTILLGVAQTILSLAKPEVGTTFQEGIQTTLAGLAIIGLGHKLDKAT